MPSMKAVRIHGYGGPDVLMYEDAPCPTPAPNEVLIRVHATTVNPFDCAARAGYMASYFNYMLPLILGTDVSGVIEDVGADVTWFTRGDDVYGRAGVFRDGTYAEYVVATASDVARKPTSLDHIYAAALPHVALTAWQGLFEIAALGAGQTVLIHGAAGGVGHVAVQLAQLRGATVIGTASTNVPLLRELGVDTIIDYSTTAFEDVAHDVDVVFDLVGGDTQERSWKVLKRGGMLVSAVQAPSEEQANAYGARLGFVVSAPPIGATLTELAALVDDGKLKPHVSQVLPLHEIRRAHEAMEGRHIAGKLAIRVAED